MLLISPSPKAMLPPAKLSFKTLDNVLNSVIPVMLNLSPHKCELLIHYDPPLNIRFSYVHMKDDMCGFI